MLRTAQFLLFGSKHFSRQAYERAARNWGEQHASVMDRKLTGKLCLVTGANQGLGLAVSEELAKRGATLFMVCRDPARGQAAVEAVRAKSGNADVHLKVCDVSSMASVRSLAEEIKGAGQPVYCLVNNAGVMIHERKKTAEGLDVNFATNTMGAWLLTRELLPMLLHAPPAKVIFVTSGGMYTQKLEVKGMEQGMPRSEEYDGVDVYAKDKRRQVAITERFAKLWGAAGVHFYAMHPGWAATEGVKTSIPRFYSFYKNKFRDLAQGIDTIVYLALQDDEQLEPGGLYLDRTPQIKHLSWGGTQYSEKDVDALWARLEELSTAAPESPA